jgi:glycosyltransferase involved in cell wall biosynthesis
MSRRFGEYSAFARTPSTETRHGIEIDHPRYPLIPKIGMSSAPLAMFAAMLPLLRRQIHDGRDFDLIDAHYFYPDGVAAVLLGRALHRPVVVTARGDDIDLISRYPIPRRWIQWAASHAAGLVAVSNGLKRSLHRLGVPAARVRMLRNGIDTIAFRPVDRQAARGALGFRGPTILAVGNLVAKKRHTVIVGALRQLPSVDLVIVGDGPERARIEELARDFGVADRVRLLGRKPQETLPEIYCAADLLIHPSSREGWPNVLLESMACGTPVVVADFDGVSDIVTAPEAGRILAAATPECIAATIGDMLRAPVDRAATRHYAEAFSWDTTTRGQINLFNQICINPTANALTSGIAASG